MFCSSIKYQAKKSFYESWWTGVGSNFELRLHKMHGEVEHDTEGRKTTLSSFKRLKHAECNSDWLIIRWVVSQYTPWCHDVWCTATTVWIETGLSWIFKGVPRVLNVGFSRRNCQVVGCRRTILILMFSRVLSHIRNNLLGKSWWAVGRYSPLNIHSLMDSECKIPTWFTTNNYLVVSHRERCRIKSQAVWHVQTRIIYDTSTGMSYAKQVSSIDAVACR